jgi:hypothetical protein
MADMKDIFKLENWSWNVAYNNDSDMVVLDKCTTEGNGFSGSTGHIIYYIPMREFSYINLPEGEASERLRINLAAGYASTTHMWDYNWEDPRGEGRAAYGIGTLDAILVIENGKIADIENMGIAFEDHESDNAFYDSQREFLAIAKYMSKRLGK